MRILAAAIMTAVLAWPAAALTVYRSEACGKRQARDIPAASVLILRGSKCQVATPKEVAVRPVLGIQVLRGRQLTIVDPR